MRSTKVKLNKSALRNLVKAVSFILIFNILLCLASQIVIPKSNKDLLNFNAGGIMSLPANSLDYLVIGNSNAVEGFSPLDIWYNFGYAGYTCGEPWQNTCGSYYMLLQILKRQSPKAVVLDTDTLYENRTTVNSLENDLAIATQYFVPVMRYHNYWKKLGLSDFAMNDKYTWHHIDYGHAVYTKTAPYSGVKYMAPTNTVKAMTPQIIYYLEKIVSLCRERGISLILASIPSPTYWNMARHNAVASYANTHAVSYVDLNLNYQDYGLNWATDTRDRGEHLNCYGARKVSIYIGKYILEKYSLPNHKGDSAYAQWDKDYLSYASYIANTKPVT